MLDASTRLLSLIQMMRLRFEFDADIVKAALLPLARWDRRSNAFKICEKNRWLLHDGWGCFVLSVEGSQPGRLFLNVLKKHPSGVDSVC